MKLYAMAEHRQAYAGWCGRNGVKQNHAVFMNTPEKIEGLALEHEQFIFIDGWQKNKRNTELLAAYASATLAKRQENP